MYNFKLFWGMQIAFQYQAIVTCFLYKTTSTKGTRDQTVLQYKKILLIDKNSIWQPLLSDLTIFQAWTSTNSFKHNLSLPTLKKKITTLKNCYQALMSHIFDTDTAYCLQKYGFCCKRRWKFWNQFWTTFIVTYASLGLDVIWDWVTAKEVA